MYKAVKEFLKFLNKLFLQLPKFWTTPIITRTLKKRWGLTNLLAWIIISG